LEEFESIGNKLIGLEYKFVKNIFVRLCVPRVRHIVWALLHISERIDGNE
jgi:hypothetical protein